jgi:hypothetical protein
VQANTKKWMSPLVALKINQKMNNEQQKVAPEEVQSEEVEMANQRVTVGNTENPEGNVIS